MTPYADDYLRHLLTEVDNGTARIESVELRSLIVTEKGIYKTEALIENADKYFPPTTLAYIPERARRDFCDAGKCLAFELPTACSFHLWRAVETVMGFYYERLTGNTCDEDGVPQNWAAQIKALRDKKADNGITEFLDHIRQQYRNPQTHPDQTVDLSEALILFGSAASAINQMTSAISKLKGSLPLPLGELIEVPF